jgi:GYF domain 2
MIEASANWSNEALQGQSLSLADLLPPSSRQDLLSTLPGVAPQNTPARYAGPCSSHRMSETHEDSGPISSLSDPNRTLSPDEIVDEPRTEWCVDFGPVLAPMDTFELWAAIDRGDVRSEMRVWREGMECWTPVGKVSELAFVFGTASSRTPEPVTLEPAAAAPLPPLAPRSPEPAFVPPREESRPRLETLVSGPRQSGWERISQRILPSPSRQRASAHFWVALGSAVAATVITAAVISAESPRIGVTTMEYAPAAAAPPSAPSLDAVAPAVPPALELAALPSAPEPSSAAVTPPPPATAAKAPVARAAAPRTNQPRFRHDERGQRRLRRSGMRPYGL